MAELTRDDFDPGDWDAIIEAAHPVFAEIADITHHRTADGEWRPWAEHGDTAALCREVRTILDQFDRRIRAARAELTRAERTARLRAHRRTPRGEA